MLIVEKVLKNRGELMDFASVNWGERSMSSQRLGHRKNWNMWKLAEQPSDTDIPLGTLLDRTTLLKLSPLNGAVPPRKLRHVVPVLMVVRPPPRQGSQKVGDHGILGS